VLVVTAIICLHGSLEDRLRLERAVARGGDLVVVAPPAVREPLGAIAANAVWTADEGQVEIAAPTASLSRAVAAAYVVRDLHRRNPINEIRYAALNGDGWAIALFSRQGPDLDAVRLVAELPGDATPLTQPVGLGDDVSVAVEKHATRAALRDADVVEGDDSVRAALGSAGFRLGSPRSAASRERPSVSAVVTHFNLERFLPACLESLRNQTVPVDIVLVDDGSSPAAMAVVEEEGRRDAHLEIIQQGNEGVVAARNAGIAASSGELVLIVDADNVIRPRMVEVLTEALLRRPEADAAVSAFRGFADDDGRTLFHYCPIELEPAPLFIANVAGDACALHRREALLAVGGFHAQGSVEDWDLWLRYLAAGRATAVVPEVLFEYRVRQDSRLRRPSRIEELYTYLAIAASHPAVLARVSREVCFLGASRLQQLLDGANHDGRAQASQEFEVVRKQAAEHAASLEARALEAEQRLGAEQVSREELKAALEELRSSSAVRAAERLRALSPDLHQRAGKLLRALLRTGRD
jgi:GT2 family glycosyltransferase